MDDARQQQLLEALLARAGHLMRYTDTVDDPLAVSQAVDLLRRVAAALPPGHPDQGHVLSTLDGALQRRYERTGALKDLHESVDVGRQALAATPPGHVNRVAVLSNLGNSLGTRYERLRNPDDLDESIALTREAAGRVPGDHPQRASIIMNLAALLLSRSGHDDEAIGLLRRAAALCRAGSWEQIGVMSNLGLALKKRFGHTGQPADLDAAVDVLRRMVDSLPAAHPRRLGVLVNLAETLRLRAAHSGSLPDLDEAITIGRRLLAGSTIGTDVRTAGLIALSSGLADRFARTDELADADAAVGAWRQVVAELATDHPDRPGLVAKLSHVLNDRLAHSDARVDVDEAVATARQALDLVRDRNYAGAGVAARHALAVALHARHRRAGQLADLDESLDHLRQAADRVPPGSPMRSTALSALATVLRARYEHAGDPADLDAAITAGEEAVSIPADPLDPERYADHLSLGNALRRRYERTGAQPDLDRAVDELRRAVDKAPAHHASVAMARSDLGGVLLRRFERAGALADIDEAVGCARQAVEARPPGHPDRPRLLNALGIALMTRFDRTRQKADIDEAVLVDRQAVDGTPPDHPDVARREVSLSNALQVRSRRLADPDDAQAAVDAARRALGLLPPGHADRHRYLSTLSSALRTLHLPGHGEAIDAQTEALGLVPPGHPVRAVHLINLMGLYNTTGAGEDRQKALAAAREAATLTTAPVHLRVSAARAWGDIAASAGRWPDAADGYTTAVGLLDRLAARGLGRTDQEYWLAESSGLGADAAASHLRAGRPGRAAEVWEQGRGVLLGRALEMRSDVAALGAGHPALAAAFARLSTDQATHLPGDEMTVFDGETGNELTDRRWALAREWDDLVTQVRDLGGEFRDFLKPPPLERLLPAAVDGPVIVVNVSRWRCDALIIRPEDGRGDAAAVEPVPLTGLDIEDVGRRTVAYLAALHAVEDAARRYHQAQKAFDDGDETPASFRRVSHARVDFAQARDDVEKQLAEVTAWLWDAVVEPVWQALSRRPWPGDPAEPRLWWCPTGLLTLLPLHAAGHHTADGVAAGKTLLDRVVCSYTPTVRALAEARRPLDRDRAEDRLLLVTAPDVHDQLPLPNVERERRMLSRRFGDAVTPLHSGDATVAGVRGQLPGHRWVHFSCHATQMLDDPSHGGLVLHDGVLTVTGIGAGEYHGEFAFLSACKTMTGGVALPDEAITLAAAMHYTGFRHVIATQWSVYDATAADVAEQVYATLFESGRFRPERSAHALHAALLKLRHLPLSLWTPFTHTGL
ncbi:CHAT domain-containing protein [Actinoplanes sp. CA-142083]|uniref:CHAT domain-containing protein n=1 Tax=Actinoplanes sp. CA-142083 TaxID=3239903 RepID=UPI003D90C9C9